MMSTRGYDNSRRAEAARLTRAKVLAAARDRFLQVGYHGTTIAALARAARVSPQTIYNTFGGKAEVLKAVYDTLLAGDDEPIAMNDRPEMIHVRTRDNAPETLRAYAAFARMLVARTGPLLGVVLAEGAGSDAELRAFLATIDRERRFGNTGVVRHIQQRFGLGGMDLERAVDLIWTLTSPEIADRLVRRCGWSADDYQRWLADALVDGLRELPR
ncbi:TetR/AcrR family transcriptional regulator [Micropruina sp.]|uniref:TetR/AcrR family transcriptional regulator n=1 Tax=Micropruina sp. TaxID=2737536 RepID=UPI00261A9767|nr:TetR/AcrR family transcriptional regulator [Micropruina sp.]